MEKLLKMNNINMKKQPINFDKLSIGLSFLCALHCLALPFAVVLIPSLIALPLADEAFHKWMVFIVLPISLFALTMGCKGHKRYRVLLVGGVGLTILAGAAFFGHDLLGHNAEKVLTLIGTSIIAIGHYWNYKLCQTKPNCACNDETSSH